MNKGVIVETGTHKTLMELDGGMYRDLVHAQEARSQKEVSDFAGASASDAPAAEEEDPDAVVVDVAAPRVSTVRKSTGANRGDAMAAVEEGRKKSGAGSKVDVEEAKKKPKKPDVSMAR
jgi:hypothetical protein